jgi:hypothetical protein
VNRRPPGDGARGDPGAAGRPPVPEIADIDSTFDLSEFAPDSLRDRLPGAAVARRAGTETAGSFLGLSDAPAVERTAAAVSGGAPERRRAGIQLPAALASLWDRPERAVAAAGALVLLLAVAIAAVSLGHEERLEPNQQAVARASSSASASAPTSGMTASGRADSDGAAAPASPPAATGVAAARPPRRPAQAGTEDRETRLARAAARAPAPQAGRASKPPSVGTTGAETHGWVALRSPIVVEMWQGGRLLGRAGARVRLPAGSHVLDLVNERLNYREQHTVTITAGATSQLRLDAPRAAISLNAIPWAAVWIDGTRIGETPLAEVPITVGEHVVRFEHPQLGDRRTTVLVRAGEVARVSVNLRQ